MSLKDGENVVNNDQTAHTPVDVWVNKLLMILRTKLLGHNIKLKPGELDATTEENTSAMI